ncbi:MAG: hypothetical protein ACYC3V_20005, partial [Chloroflexota bacterium]
MTAFIAYLHPTVCFVAMDTIAPTRSGRIVGHCDKFTPIHHLRMAVCSSGVTEVHLDWLRRVLDEPGVRDIDDLDKLAPRALLEISERKKASCGIQVGVPGSWDMANVHHFGWSPQEEAMVGYRYHSERFYASERLGYGLTCQRGRGDGDLEDVRAFFA